MSQSSFVKIWEFDGKASSSQKMNMGSPTVKTEFIRYYQGVEGSDQVATNGDGSCLRKEKKTIITLPIGSKASVVNMSPFKMEQTILPKTVHLSSSPVILSTPQRIVANVISSRIAQQQTVSDHISWSGKRQNANECDYPENKKCKKGEKGGKGLRHFSMKVCEKVRKKGTTSYNEVADELVAEFTDPHQNYNLNEQAYDQKNIRRRVYDALNVLMAMNIISKEKKEIKWLGLPTNSAQEYQNLERDKQKRLERIQSKMQHLQELIHQQVAFKNLIERNKYHECQKTLPLHASRIHLPFIIINTGKKTLIDCSISTNKTEYVFRFNNTFQIHDDMEILKRMGLVLNLDQGCSSSEELQRAKELVPKVLWPYVIQMAQGKSEFTPGMSSQGNNLMETSDDPTSDFQEASSSSIMDSEYVGLELALESSQTDASRQSSAGSDMPSRPEVSTPEDYTDQSDCESSGDEI